MQYKKRSLHAIALIIVALAAMYSGQASATDAVLTWQPPTHNTAGVQLTADDITHYIVTIYGNGGDPITKTLPAALPNYIIDTGALVDIPPPVFVALQACDPIYCSDYSDPLPLAMVAPLPPSIRLNIIYQLTGGG